MAQPEIDTRPKKHPWKRVVLIIFAILCLLVIGLFLFINHFINRSLPDIEGTIELPILEDEVVVTTDENGVPHIQATSTLDLFTAQGYVQAQNRLFQMELSRHQASGTLSEIIGEDMIENDKYFRTLGLRRAAEKSYDHYSDEAKQVLQAFTDGVNAYIEEAKENRSLPVEFTLLGSKPDEWTPLDSLTIGKYMAFDLGGHWEQQAFNYELLNNFSDEKAYELFPHYPENRPTIIEEGEIENVEIASNINPTIIPNPFNGSNNWAVSGDKTKNGLPLLADDPHLGLATPSIWLQMHLEAEDINVSGVIFAGIPGIILGHNESIAWGVTNTGPDVQQLYIEKQHPEHEHKFLFEDEWKEATVIDEPIHVKDGETIDYKVIETRNGPIISEFAQKGRKKEVLSLRWTALDPTTELEAILDMNRATNWREFEKGLEKFLVPTQNFVFAAKDGTIAYKANGRIPIYENSDDALLPLPGWDETYEWKDYIPFSKLPKVINPKKGFIATANNKVVSNDYPYHISNVWAQPYRYERIAEVLENNDDLTVEDMQDLQMDTTNLRAKEFVPLFEETLSDVNLSAPEREALDRLTHWNFKDDVNLAEPLIFHHLFDDIEQIIYEDIPNDINTFFKAKSQTTDELLRHAETSQWIKDKGGLKKILKQAFEQTTKKLTDKYGEDMDKWAWGDYHRVQFQHPLSSVHPMLEYFFNREKPIPVDGSHVTPMAASYEQTTGEVDHGASWRFVIDMQDPTVGYHIVGPGQEGHFKSQWYHDQMDDWVNGTFHQTDITHIEGAELILTPASK